MDPTFELDRKERVDRLLEFDPHNYIENAPPADMSVDELLMLVTVLQETVKLYRERHWYAIKRIEFAYNHGKISAPTQREQRDNARKSKMETVACYCDGRADVYDEFTKLLEPGY